MVGEFADKFFPMRDENNKPTYRKHQRETIIKIVKAYVEGGKKFVCLDGPVGCGKSVILYTAGMVLSHMGEPGSTTYLTHQKQLQDQVVKERWPEVKMVKGRSSYCCNGATTIDNRIRCNYSGERYKTCQNSDEKTAIGVGSDTQLMKTIEKIRGLYDGNETIFRSRTGFEHGEAIAPVFQRIRDFVVAQHPDEPPPGMVSVYGCIGCSVGIHECPVKSSRLQAKMAKVRILNPDVFYMLNRSGVPFFPNSKLMVFDECHKIENIVDRIFGGCIHIDFLKKYFGIDMSELYSCETTQDFTDKYMSMMNAVVMPAKAAAIIMTHLAPVMSMTYLGGGQKFSTITKDDLVVEFASVSRSMGESKVEFNMLQFLNDVFSDNGDAYMGPLGRLWNYIREKYRDLCGDFDCVQKFYGFRDMCISADPVESMRRIAWYSEAISHLEDVVSLMAIENSFMFSSNKVDIRKEYKGTEMNRFVKDNITDWKDAYMQSVKLTPINIPKMMNVFFYSKAEHILLSTGTWVDPKSTMKTFGVDLDSVEFISIPTTFEPGRRPVYILQGPEYADFSEKIDGAPWYVYKTDEGTDDFTAKLSETISSVREYFRHRSGLNINVIVHSFSFDIAKRIARRAPDVDDSWLIQIASGDVPIKNDKTGHTTSFVYKDELLQHIMSHPNCGLTFVSASVNEGVDFKHDIARAQVILKRPTPNISDPYVKAQYRGNPAFNIPKDPNYLDRATYTDMIQMYGRIMRAQDDWGVTIIYDQAITNSFKYLLSSRGAWKVRELGLDYMVSAVKGGLNVNGNPFFNWPFGGAR